MTDFAHLYPDNRETGDTPLRQAQLVMLRMMKIIDHICRKHHLRYWLCSGTLLGAVRHQGFIPWDDDLDICMIREDYEQFLRIAPKEFPDDIFLQTAEADPTYDYLPLPCKIRDKKSRIIAEGMENQKYQQGLFVDIFPVDRFHRKGISLWIEKGIKTYFRFITKCLDAKLGKDRSMKNKAVAFFHPVFKALTVGYKKAIGERIRKNLELADGNCLFGPGFDTPWRRYFTYDEIFPLQEMGFEDASFLVPHTPATYLTQLYGKDYMTPPPVKERGQRHAVILEPILKNDKSVKENDLKQNVKS